MTKTPQKRTLIGLMIKHIRNIFRSESLVQECAQDDTTPLGYSQVGNNRHINLDDALNEFKINEDLRIEILNKND